MTHERLEHAMRVVILAGIIVLALLVLRGVIEAQDRSLTAGLGSPGNGAPGASSGDSHAEPSLERSLLRAMIVWTRPSDGRVQFVSHCRAAPRGCEARVHVLATEMRRAARVHRVDAWTLAAIAIRESGLNPAAVGAAGETSVFQLHPRGASGRRLARACRRSPSRCESAAVWLAAEHLRAAIDRCGSQATALGAYNSGTCGESNYALRVLARRARLLAADGGGA